ncbi:MAG: glycosyltransferase family A protein [Anaerolineales bacterium]
MRVGQNPIKSVGSVEPPALVTVVVFSSIPFLSGYFSESLDVLKLCLSSLRRNTRGEFDLMLFDNGSCAAVRKYLIAEQDKNRIQFLILSARNIGKPAAWNAALTAAPGEYVAYADSDVYFNPGWLKASLDTLKAFPKAGMVTAMPMLIPETYSTATVKWAKKNPEIKLERGHLLPWEDFWRHARSLGDTEQQARAFYQANPIVRITYKKKRFFAGAAHFQFTARKTVLQRVLPIPAEKPMGRVRLLDEAINAAGYLRLCTEDWHVQHMGNLLPQASDLISPVQVPVQRAKNRGKIAKIWRWEPIRKLLQWIYGWSFDRLHRGGS